MGEYKSAKIKQIEELIGEGKPIEKIVKSLYLDKDFKSTYKVGEVLWISEETVRRYLKKVRVERIYEGSKEGIKQIEELLGEGEPFEKIVKSLYLDKDFKSTYKVEEVLGVTARTVNNYLKKAGTEVKDVRQKNISLKKYVELYKKYGTAHKVGRVLGVGLSNVYENLKKAGTEVKDSRQKDIPLERYVTLYKKHGSTLKVGEILRVSPQTVNKNLKKARIKLNNNRAFIEQIEELIGEGESFETICKTLYLDKDFKSTVKIGEVLGVSAITINKHLKKAGVGLQHKRKISLLEEVLKE